MSSTIDFFINRRTPQLKRRFNVTRETSFSHSNQADLSIDCINEPKHLPLMLMPDLPDNVLCHFFACFSLQEQICLRVVSSKWAALITVHFLKKKHSLKLFTCLEDVKLYAIGLFMSNFEVDPYYRLSFVGMGSDNLVIDSKKWDSKLFATLKTLLPNIKHLIIYINSHKEAGYKLDKLLKLYPALESFSLCGKFDFIPDTTRKPLFDLLNHKMPALKRLDIRSSEIILHNTEYKYVAGDYSLFYLERKLLHQLEQFSIYPAFIYYLPEVITPLGPKLTSLRIDRLPCTDITLEHLQMSFQILNPRLMQNVTQLYLSTLGTEGDKYVLPTLDFICNHFKQLQAFHFEFPRYTSTLLTMEILSPLAKLNYLNKLYLGFISFPERCRTDECNNLILTPPLPILPTVKHLSICLSKGRTRFQLNKFDADKFSTDVSQAFISLEVLILKPYKYSLINGKSELLNTKHISKFLNLVKYEVYTSKCLLNNIARHKVKPTSAMR